MFARIVCSHCACCRFDTGSDSEWDSAHSSRAMEPQALMELIKMLFPPGLQQLIPLDVNSPAEVFKMLEVAIDLLILAPI